MPVPPFEQTESLPLEDEVIVDCGHVVLSAKIEENEVPAGHRILPHSKSILSRRKPVLGRTAIDVQVNRQGHCVQFLRRTLECVQFLSVDADCQFHVLRVCNLHLRNHEQVPRP